RYLAYVSKENSRYSLWVRQIANPSAVQVVAPTAEVIGDVSFTPDGTYLDYVAYSSARGNGTIFQVPLLGGATRQLISAADGGVSFSPDGKQIVYPFTDYEANVVKIVVANADGAGTHVLATHPANFSYQNYQAIRWSPDGRRIATVISDLDDPNGLNVGLIEIDLSSGKEKPLGTSRWRTLTDIDW